MTIKIAEPPVDVVAARYVYCILPDIGQDDWGAIGLDGAHVYTIGNQDICALVHDCPAEPYQGDDATVKEWVWTHGAVIDAAWAQTDSVLPMTFDCIVCAALSPSQTIWREQHESELSGAC